MRRRAHRVARGAEAARAARAVAAAAAAVVVAGAAINGDDRADVAERGASHVARSA